MNIIPVNEIERMATVMCDSKLFGVQNVNQAMALMFIAQAEGSHPAIASRDYHIIQGRPTLKADAMLARFITSGGKVDWHEYTDTMVSATFTHPAGTIKVDWDMARAKKAGLGGKDMWSKYPRQMLRSRVISEAIRAIYPCANSGMYTPEEVQDFDDAVVIETKDDVKKIAPPEKPKKINKEELQPAEAAVVDMVEEVFAPAETPQSEEEIVTAYDDFKAQIDAIDNKFHLTNWAKKHGPDMNRDLKGEELTKLRDYYKEKLASLEA